MSLSELRAFEKTRLKAGEFVYQLMAERFPTLKRSTSSSTASTRFKFLVNDKPNEQGARKVDTVVISSEWTKLRYNEQVSDLQQRVEKPAKVASAIYLGHEQHRSGAIRT